MTHASPYYVVSTKFFNFSVSLPVKSFDPRCQNYCGTPAKHRDAKVTTSDEIAVRLMNYSGSNYFADHRVGIGKGLSLLKGLGNYIGTTVPMAGQKELSKHLHSCWHA